MSSLENFKNKKVLVTGATGFIGGHLCPFLKSHGAHIYAVSRRMQKKTKDIKKWQIGDLSDMNFVDKIISEIKPDYVFHLAGYVTGSRRLDAVIPTNKNILTTSVNILKAVAENKSVDRLIMAGSLEEPESGVSNIIPVSPYAAAKWATSGYARMFHQLYDTPVTIPRIFMVYGPGERNHRRLIPYVITSFMQDKQPEISSGTRLIDWIYIDDVVKGLAEMGITPNINGKTIDLGSGKKLSVKEVCKMIESYFNPSKPIKIGVKTDRPYERVSKADLGKTKKILDWEPEVDIEEGLKRTIQWYKTNKKENF